MRVDGDDVRRQSPGKMSDFASLKYQEHTQNPAIKARMPSEIVLWRMALFSWTLIPMYFYSCEELPCVNYVIYNDGPDGSLLIWKRTIPFDSDLF